MRIAIVGTRGVPANYGGFETFAEELGQRLVARGHEVLVYCRQPHPASHYLGMRLCTLPTLRHKYLETIVHTALSTLHLLTQRQEVALYCNAANAIFAWMPRLAGTRVALNVDGLERKRKKWNRLAKAWYRLSEWLATFCPDRAVSDAVAIRAYYREVYGTETTFIAYGAEMGKLSTRAALDELGLAPEAYFLYVSRMEPENNALLVREAFEQVETNLRLALIGDAPYSHDYIARVRDTQDPRIVMPGAIYGQGYKELGSHCFAYIHATEVGGTHPALIEAMGRGALVLYLDTEENREVAGGVGLPFTAASLADVLRQALALPAAERERLRAAAVARVQERYSWDAVTDAYLALFEELCTDRG
jgi:glycosyltransferase involved in cell wall biosynthesis